MFVPGFDMLYFVSFQKICNYLDCEETWLLYFNCLPGVLWLIHGSVALPHGDVCV